MKARTKADSMQVRTLGLAYPWANLKLRTPCYRNNFFFRLCKNCTGDCAKTIWPIMLSLCVYTYRTLHSLVSKPKKSFFYFFNTGFSTNKMQRILLQNAFEMCYFLNIFFVFYFVRITDIVYIFMWYNLRIVDASFHAVLQRRDAREICCCFDSM